MVIMRSAGKILVQHLASLMEKFMGLQAELLRNQNLCYFGFTVSIDGIGYAGHGGFVAGDVGIFDVVQNDQGFSDVGHREPQVFAKVQNLMVSAGCFSLKTFIQFDSIDYFSDHF